MASSVRGEPPAGQSGTKGAARTNYHCDRMRRLLTAGLVVLAAACVDHLPEQDLRILQAQPAAKLSASDLWKDFEADASGARSRYFGKAIDISDRPTAIESDETRGRGFMFSQGGERGVRARLLDEQAADILRDAKVGTRLTLRCYCEGRDAAGDVVLKSCIRP